MLFDLKRDLLRGFALFVGGVGQFNGKCVVNVGQVAHREFDVDNRTLDTRDASSGRLCSRLGSAVV